MTPSFEDTAPHRPKFPSSDSGATRTEPATLRRFCNPSSERRFGQPSPTSRSPRTTPRLSRNDRDSSAVFRTVTDPATAPILVNDPPRTVRNAGVSERTKSPSATTTRSKDASIVSRDAHPETDSDPPATLLRRPNDRSIARNDDMFANANAPSRTVSSEGNASRTRSNLSFPSTTSDPATRVSAGNGGASARVSSSRSTPSRLLSAALRASRTPPPTPRNDSNPAKCSRTGFASTTSAPPTSSSAGNAARVSSRIRNSRAFSTTRTSPPTRRSFGNTARITRFVQRSTTDPPTCVSSGNAPRRDVSAAPGATTTSPSTRSKPPAAPRGWGSEPLAPSDAEGVARVSTAAASVNAGWRWLVTTREPAMVEHRAASGVVLASTSPEHSERSWKSNSPSRSSV